MSEPIIQASFNSGEWSPKLFARVDLAKYRSGAALLQNWFVDYRGGASTRPGSRYVLQTRLTNTANPPRLIPFQASTNVGYALEFGAGYIRFFFDGAPVLETGLAINAATNANPCVINVPGNTYAIGDWIFIAGIVGMTQLNGNYYQITNVAGAAITLADLFGNPVNSTAFGVYVSGGTASRVYTITSPYAAADIKLIKYAQNVSQMVLCHPSYQPYVLTLISATNWTLLPIVIGSTATAPSSFTTAFTGISAGSVGYSYVVTSIDGNGDESSPSAAVNFTNLQDMRSVAGSISISWVAVPGAVAYNVYKTDVSYFGSVGTGQQYGYIGTVTSPGNAFVDTNITPDFSISPPIARNPFLGQGIASVTVNTPSTYTTVPGVSATGASSTIAATLAAILQVQGTPTVPGGGGGSGYHVGDLVSFTNGVVLIVATVSGTAVATWQPVSTAPSNRGSVSGQGATVPTNPVAQSSTSGTGTGATANLTWGVGQVQVLNSGAGYLATPTITFSAGAAAATATLSNNSNGFPAVPAFFQQRLILAGPTASPQTLYMSQPGQYYNFNVSNPTQATDSITATLVSGQLNTIKSFVPQTSGLLALTDRASWIINGGSPGSAISPSALVANSQSFNGVSDVPPIVANFDVLYVQAKGSIVRDSSYNIYANVYTGTDITILASHLFFGFSIVGWAWAEEPFKVVWAVRSDGTMLNLTFLKEQDFIGWTHSITAGLYQSVCVVTEAGTTEGTVDAIYTIVQRTINGVTVQYVERVVERIFSSGYSGAWCVDAGIQYVGSPVLNFSGAPHLANTTVTGLATDNLGNVTVITPFVMPVSGQFSLPAPTPPGATGYTTVTVGIGYNCDLQTLAIDIGSPTIQGRVKKINDVVVKCSETLGLSIGSSFSSLVPLKDTVLGAISTMLTGQLNQTVTGLVTGDARQALDPTFTVPGQYCIRQSNPLPATVLGVIPALVVERETRRQAEA